MTDTQKSSTMSPELARIAELAKEDKQRKFFSIAHLLTIDALYAAFLSLRTEASAGVDGVTYKQYDANTWEKIPVLHGKLKCGQYRAQPLRRIYIAKEDGRQRPISIPSLGGIRLSSGPR
jgi:retron-type reverse transcriptase